MSNLEDLEKLATLKEQGLITKAEFDEQKAALLSANMRTIDGEHQKSGTVYLVLAFFLGLFGAHNFYIGHWVRAIIQLLMTILSPFTLFVSLFVVLIWVFIEMLVTRKDAKGNPLTASPVLRIVLSILMIVLSMLPLSVCTLGGIAGYTMAMNRHAANEALDYVAQCAITAQMASTDGALNTALCSDLVEDPAPSAIISDFGFEENGQNIEATVYVQDVQTANQMRARSSETIQIMGEGPVVRVVFPWN